jgi:outer membrane translocation and assembly module TamA
MILVVFVFFLPGEVSGFSFSDNRSLNIGEITLEGNLVFSEKTIRSLLPKSDIKFSEELLKNSIEKIIDFYLDRGFPFVQIKPVQFSLDSSRINWKLIIDPGYLQKLNNVYLNGLSYTNPEFLQRKVSIERNDIFSEKEIRNNISKLDRLSYIDIDSFVIKPIPGKDLVDVIVYLKEQTGGDLEGAISYSNNGGFSGLISFSNSNLFGRGRKVQIDLEREREEYQSEFFEYTEPDILSLPLNLNFSLSHNYILDNYNLVSFASGLEYFYSDASFLMRLGLEIISSQDTSEIYPFLDAGFSFKSNAFDIFYRERFRKGRGWDLETQADIYFFAFVLKLEYFKLSLNDNKLTFYKSFRGYPGVTVKEGAVVGIEFKKNLGLITAYPFVDANFFQDDWKYSYGFGLRIKRFSLEYAVPKGISPSEGRIYFRFK